MILQLAYFTPNQSAVRKTETMSGSSIQGFKTVSYLQSGSKAEKPRRVWGMVAEIGYSKKSFPPLVQRDIWRRWNDQNLKARVPRRSLKHGRCCSTGIMQGGVLLHQYPGQEALKRKNVLETFVRGTQRWEEIS